MAQLLPPEQVQPTKAASKRVGCVLFLVAGLLVLGAGGYLAAGFLGAHVPGFGGFGQQPPITTTNLQIAAPYKGADITIVSAQQSSSFKDDPNTAYDGMLRLKIQASNATAVIIGWNYSTAASLVLPGKQTVVPIYGQFPVNLAPGKTQTNTLDFAVPSGDTLSQIVLRFGTTSEAQVAIPLAATANSSSYQPKTTNVSGTLVYFGLNYALKSASTSLSIPGEQAARGMQFLTLTLNVDNTLSQEAIPGSPFGYVRLKVGSNTASPVASTLPVSFQSGAAGVAGTITFLVDQQSSTFTLTLLPQQHDNGDQATANFSLA